MKTQVDGLSIEDNLTPIQDATSFNKLIVESYKKEGLKSVVNNGFAMIQQKVSVKGLKVLVSAKLNDGTLIPKGSTAYIKEESLHTSPWAQKILESDTLENNFIIVDISNVEYVVPPTRENL